MTPTAVGKQYNWSRKGQLLAFQSCRRQAGLPLGTSQLLEATIRGQEIWSPAQQCGGVPEPAANVDIRKNHLANHFGRHPPPLGDLLILPTRADRTFRSPSPTNEPF